MNAAGHYFLTPAMYDRIYGGITADVPQVVELVRGAGGAALEVCCGNGRLLLPILREGLACDGLDVDPHMLEDLRAKLAAEGLSTGVYEGDMRDFTLPGRYALIVIAFNSFLHNLTQEDQLATLRCCKQHLVHGGRLAIILFHPSAEKLIEYSTTDTLAVESSDEEGPFRAFDRCEDDRIEQVRHVTRRIERLDAAGKVVSEERLQFATRYIFKPEMELLLRVAGFERWAMRPLISNYRDPGSAAGERPAREGDHLLWTAWRPGA